VVLGAVVFARQPLYLLTEPLLILYFSFNVCLYGGLYILNDITDIESDRKHPQKKDRPLSSGKMSVASAYLFAFVLILFGLLIAYFYFNINIFLMYLFFIFINQIYTHTAKKIPYIEILFNSLTYPMRFFLGVLLVAAKMPYSFLLAILLLAFGVACNRRIIEKRMPGREARSVLQYYSFNKLAIIQILIFIFVVIIFVINYPLYAALYIILIIFYLISVFGIYFFPGTINFYKWLWLK
jgi:4-hydroxybenzoate polyprenyltransferase